MNLEKRKKEKRKKQVTSVNSYMHFTATWHAIQIMAAVTAAAAAAAGSLAQSSCNIRVSIPLLPRTCANVLYSAKNLIRRNQVKPIILTFSRNLRTSTDFRYPNHSLFRPCHALAADAAYFSVAAESLYDFSVNDIDGKEVPLNKYKAKVVLVVNVASKCGLTPSNYTELSHLYEKYKAQGFEILAFPCNQFGGQEPGKNSEIKEFACTRYKAEFPIFDKIDVNGPNTAPVYNYLKSSKGGGLLGDNIKWNFEKFLIDKNGKVVERYLPVTSPFQIEKDIQKLLAA